MWNILKKLKCQNLSKKVCTIGQLSIDGTTGVLNQVNEVMLQVWGYDMLDKIKTLGPLKNMTDTILQRAANMFIYMIFCPDDTKAWIFFYTDLFQNQPADKIVLTLNRILKSKASKKRDKFHIIARKLYTKITTFLSFKSKDIQNMIQGITETF